MRILLAPDSFKGSLTAFQVAASMSRGIKKVLPRAQTVKMPLSDGGEGLVDALVGATGGKLLRQQVTGPLGGPLQACWGILGGDKEIKTGVIEMAAASGLTLVPPAQRNPMLSTTYGTGELIRAALQHDCSRLIIGIGGSATNDGGMGMAQALGVRFLDGEGENLPFGGGGLLQLARIDMDGLEPTLQKVSLLVACDVDNPLTGPQGAAAVYGPQKGADSTMVRQLDRGLQHLAAVIATDLGIEVEHIRGAGAAGGLGAGLMAFLGAELAPGIEIVMDLVGLEKELAKCELVFTGEGRLDAQSAFGKVPVGVARRARNHGIPVIALAGSVAQEAAALHEEGITAYFSIANAPIPLEEAMANAAANIELTIGEIMRVIHENAK